MVFMAIRAILHVPQIARPVTELPVHVQCVTLASGVTSAKRIVLLTAKFVQK